MKNKNSSLACDCIEYFIKRYPRKLRTASLAYGFNGGYMNYIKFTDKINQETLDNVCQILEHYEANYGKKEFKQWY